MKNDLKILVTGASGFAGGRITQALQGEYCLLTPSHKQLDITSEKEVENAFKRCYDTCKNFNECILSCVVTAA